MPILPLKSRTINNNANTDKSNFSPCNWGQQKCGIILSVQKSSDRQDNNK